MAVSVFLFADDVISVSHRIVGVDVISPKKKKVTTTVPVKSPEENLPLEVVTQPMAQPTSSYFDDGYDGSTIFSSDSSSVDSIISLNDVQSEFSHDDVTIESNKMKRSVRRRKKSLEEMTKGKSSFYINYMFSQEDAVLNKSKIRNEWRRNRRDLRNRAKYSKKSVPNASVASVEKESTTTSSPAEVQQTQEAKAEGKNIEVIPTKTRSLFERVSSQICFEAFHTLPALGCVVLFAIMQHCIYSILYQFVYEYFTYDYGTVKMLILYAGIVVMRFSGVLYSWAPSDMYELVKFDVHNKACLGDFDANVFRWFHKHSRLKFLAQLFGYYLIMYGMDYKVSEDMMWRFCDVKQDVLANLPSLQYDHVRTYAKTLLSLQTDFYFYAEEMWGTTHEVLGEVRDYAPNYCSVEENKAACEEIKKKKAAHEKLRSSITNQVVYDDVRDEHQCELLGFFENGEDSDEDDEEDEENTTTCVFDRIVDKIYYDDDEEDVEEIMDKCRELGFMGRQDIEHDKYAWNGTEYYKGKVFSNYHLSQKELDDDFYVYSRVSKSSYFGMMGYPDSLMVSFSCAMSFYATGTILMLIVFYQFDLWYLVA